MFTLFYVLHYQNTMSIFQLLLIIICCFEFDCEILVFSIDRCEKYMGNVNIRYCKNKVNDKLILEGQARRAIFTTIETSTEFTLKRKLLPHLTKIEIINGYCPHKIFTDFLVVVTGPDDDEMCEVNFRLPPNSSFLIFVLSLPP